MYGLLLNLGSDDSDVTEVFLVFEQFLYDVCGVFRWLNIICKGMRGSKVWTLKLKSGSFVDCYGF